MIDKILFPISFPFKPLETFMVRLVPVQITIPAQQGNPNSQPRALTVQVPAHALQTGGSSGVTLQQVLTQAITQALSLPPEHAAMYLQTQINQAFRLG